MSKKYDYEEWLSPSKKNNDSENSYNYGGHRLQPIMYCVVSYENGLYKQESKITQFYYSLDVILEELKLKYPEKDLKISETNVLHLIEI